MVFLKQLRTQSHTHIHTHTHTHTHAQAAGQIKATNAKFDIFYPIAVVCLKQLLTHTASRAPKGRQAVLQQQQ